MRITGDGGLVDLIQLRYDSSDLRYRQTVPLIFKRESFDDNSKMNSATITFSDSAEIDILINMLERYKKSCFRDAFGRWIPDMKGE